MFKIIIPTLLILTIAICAFAERVEFRSAEVPFSTQIVQSEAGKIIIQYRLNYYEKSNITIAGKEYLALQKLPKESITEEKGYPRLPKINRSIIIPDEGAMGIKVLATKFIDIEGVFIAPSKGHLLRTEDWNSVPYTFGDIYNRDEYYPKDLCILGEPYILRDFRGLVVEINAFQYNPVWKTLRIYTEVTLEVEKVAPGGENILIRNRELTKIDPQFQKIYRRHFLNYNQLDYPVLLETGTMLVICYDSFLDEMEPFVEWKNQKGLPTEIVPVSQVGTTPNIIKNYIFNYYNQHDLGYVLIVGDHAQVPSYTGDSDPVFACLVGGDNYADIFVGRFSAENGAQVVTQVQRTITYEKYPDPNGQWYSKGLGDADEDGPCNPEQYDYQHISRIAQDLLNWNYTQVDSVYTVYGGTTAQIVNYMNEGRSIFNYAGHGWINMVGPVNFTSANANALVNDNKLFHMVAVACQPGNFFNNTCLAEDLLRSVNEATGAPAGAIAVYLSAISQSWFPPYDMQDEGVDLLVADSMLTFGGMCFNGGMLMIDLFGAQGINEFLAWTIFGDPSVMLRSATPYNLTVVHNPQIPLGIANFEVTVSSPTGPLQGAMVCGMNDEIYAHGITNTNGQVTLNFDPLPTLADSFTLTVSGGNAIPYITGIDIVPIAGPYIIYAGSSIQDDLMGNNNGQLDYGETTDLALTLHNIGLSASGNLSVVLSTNDSLVTVLQNSANFAPIAPDSFATLNRAFQLQISSTVNDGHPVSLTIDITDGIGHWVNSFSISANAPLLVVEDFSVDDSLFGNHNGNLDPGETAILNIDFTNDGGCYTSGLQATLTTTDPFVTINTGAIALGTVLTGGNAQGAYSVTVSTACPQEHTVNFSTNFTDAIGYSDSDDFSLIVGDVMFLPTGPDAYGYSAYNPFDLPEMPVYQWVEISADSGGPGTRINFTADDQILPFALPFEFQYYGVDYDSFSLSSNGYLCMGVVTTDDYSNSAIPNSDGPPAMIAVYWEDLSPQRTNSGGVWSYYDSTNHYFIIEYNHIEQFAPTTNFETFEVILYDPAHYLTVTGDGRIKANYKQMSNASQVEGTVGIENQAETVGLQYLFDGDLDAHAMPVSGGMCVLFTTLTNLPTLDVTITPVNPPIVIPSTGGSFNYSVLITNPGTIVTNFDVWVMATLPNGTNFGPIFTRLNMSLLPGGQLTRNMMQNVPGNAPAGLYTYTMLGGDYSAGLIYDQSSFDFTKQGTVENSGSSTWILSGWDEELADADFALPAEFALFPNHPNPFNPETNISYSLPELSQVQIEIFNIRGQLVMTLTDGLEPAGYKNITWLGKDDNGNPLSSGIYFYRLTAEGKISGERFVRSEKMLLLR
jgi:hypothetical protein